MPGAAPFSALAALFAVLGSSAAVAQSTLVREPVSDAAITIAEISDVLFIGAMVIFALMVVLVFIAMCGPERARRSLARPTLILIAGVVFPVTVLTLLLTYSLNATTQSLTGADKSGAAPAIRITITGELWWWRAHYGQSTGEPWFETANDIRIPVGVPVELVLISDNVIHSFWVPELGGKLDLVPGHTNRMIIRARSPGTFQGQCAEYCGAQHARMRFTVQAMAPAAFDAWVAAQRQPIGSVAPALQRGAQLFMNACANCHTVRGTGAAGTMGPDLTHVGSRQTLAAGTLPNNVGALAGWIAASQDLKPGNPMPSFDHWSGADLRAVATYLDSLN